MDYTFVLPDVVTVFYTLLMCVIAVGLYKVIRKMWWESKQNNLLQGYGSAPVEQERDILTPVVIVVVVCAINFIFSIS